MARLASAYAGFRAREEVGGGASRVLQLRRAAVRGLEARHAAEHRLYKRVVCPGALIQARQDEVPQLAELRSVALREVCKTSSFVHGESPMRKAGLAR